MKTRNHGHLGLIMSFLVTLAYAGPVAEKELVGSWQVGLFDEIRDVPNGRAFDEGLTAAVFTFRADKSLRVEMPCRYDKFIKEFGEFVMVGTWELKEDGTLLQSLEMKGGQFDGQKRSETQTVSFDRGMLVLTRLDGNKIQLGRFKGDTKAPCKFE